MTTLLLLFLAVLAYGMRTVVHTPVRRVPRYMRRSLSNL